MLTIRRIALSAVAAAILASAAQSSAPATSSQALKIVAFGSSSTQGVGASTPSASYPSQLETILRQTMPGGPGVDVVNRGIGGEDADDMVKRLDKDVIQRRPNLVIFQTGSNDPMRHVPLDRFEQETRDSIRAMQTAGIKVMLMEPQWCPHLAAIGNANAYRDIVRKVGTEMGVQVIRRYDMMQEWVRTGRITRHDMISDDNLHMRDKGYTLLARSVATEILRIEAETPRVAQAAQVTL